MNSLSLRRLILSMRSRYHLWSGRRAYRMGRMRRAGEHFREALASGADSFEAWLLLGKIYFRENDFARSASAFERARSTNPVMFEREGYPKNFIKTLAAQGRAARHPEYRIVIQAAAEGRREGRPQRVPHGEFRSREEWLRLRDKPAIRPGEGAAVDWDEAAGDLFDD